MCACFAATLSWASHHTPLLLGSKLSNLTLQHMSSRILFNLPEALSRLVIVEWLYLKHIVRLDSAFCSLKFRVLYQSLTYGQRMKLAVAAYQQSRRQESILAWVVSRGVQLSELWIDSDTPHNSGLLRDFLAIAGSGVDWIEVYGDTSTNDEHRHNMLEVAKWRPSVEVVCVYGSGHEYMLPSLTHAFKNYCFCRWKA
jgi:hypothetical protein